MKYYLILCHRGHCGVGHSSEIEFAIAANNFLEARDKARRMPSVQHTREIIRSVEITETQYHEYRQISAYNRFEQHKSKRRR